MVNCTTIWNEKFEARTLTVAQKTLIPLEFKLIKTLEVLFNYYLLFCLARQKLSVFSHHIFLKNEKVSQCSKLITPLYDCFFTYGTEY